MAIKIPSQSINLEQISQREQYKAWYLIGIVSFGSKKCGNGVPGIYTRVRERNEK